MANDELLTFVENERKNRKDYSLAYEELYARQKELQTQIAQQQAMIHQQERELNNNRKRIKEEQINREKQFQKELEERDRLFEHREQALLQRQKYMEEVLHDRMSETEAARQRLATEIAAREEALKKAEDDIEQEKTKYREENRKLIESKSQNYVNSALSGLEQKENSFHTISKIWSGIGAAAIAFGILFATYSTYLSAESFHSGNGFSWTYFLFITLRGLVLIAMFIALARYSFIYSNSYMHESLKSGERRHAINFGKFYLEAYGADANWTQIKEAFQHWNISNRSAFSNTQPDNFDPKIMEKAVEIANIISKAEKDQAAEKDQKP
ncbi:TPA: hypothetical protein L3934_006130 [Pseudomonas aeruginosa]|uniref:hypothetical protein n=1 Tax=Pseudomonas aeruginosa TaxID=287 RepID=UPI00136EA143|nr:hypothetical protein [Pseudomonas aeruginosa]MXU52376.1 hypothetical protein [Pseudomonas aeruginosa]HBN9846898.1 hypothetical protein [Pseudomonas aeruginosa]HBN9848094.1 hypothetical protein [Pseudomonas aeruginosa]